MKRWPMSLILVALLLSAVGPVCGFLSWLSWSSSSGVQASAAVDIAIDMDVTGNDATTVGTIEPCAELSASTDSGTITDLVEPIAGILTGIADSSKSWTANEWVGFRVRTSGANPISAVITANTANTLSFAAKAAPYADLGDSYQIVDFLPVDVVVDQIPSGDNMTGFQFYLTFDTSLVKVAGADDGFLISADGSGTLTIINKSGSLPVDDPFPIENTPWLHAVSDTGPTETNLAGVLTRFELEPAGGTGVSALDLSDVIISDDQVPSQLIPITTVQDGAILVGEGECVVPPRLTPTPTPTPTPIPTPTPTLTPTPAPTPTEPENPTGDGPASVAVTDLNGDGASDLVTANTGSCDVSVLLGNGDGTFQPQQRFGLGACPNSLAVADLDGDDAPDVVTANYLSDDVSVLLGSGDGTFQTEQRFGVGFDPHSVAVADLNGDGAPDLVTANSPSDDVSVLLGNGDGTFQTHQRFGVGVDPRSVAVADLDGDGSPDLVTADYLSGDVSVLLGNGDGTFQTQRRHGAGDSPYSVAVADLDGDAAPDLVITNRLSDDISVLLGRGDGTFQTQQRFAAGDCPSSVAVADLDSDGTPDLVTANYLSDDVSVLLGNGDGTFLHQQRFAVGSRPHSVAVADLDGNGIPDLVTANYLSNDVSVLLHWAPVELPLTGGEPAMAGNSAGRGWSPAILAVVALGVLTLAASGLYGVKLRRGR